MKMYPAGPGDCVRIKYEGDDGENHNIVIDTGTRTSYKNGFKALLTDVIADEEIIDLLVISHYDLDHIGGILEAYSDDKFSDDIIHTIWFNAKMIVDPKSKLELFEFKFEKIKLPNENNNMGAKHSGQLSELIAKSKINWHSLPACIENNLNENFYGLTIKFISPFLSEINELFEFSNSTNMKSLPKDHKIDMKVLKDRKWVRQEKESKHKSSMSFIFEFEDIRVLYLSDTSSASVIEGLLFHVDGKQSFDAVKLSHHCSARNFSKEMLELIECHKYLISSDGSKYGHPNKEVIARILERNKTASNLSELYFNYPIENTVFTEQDKKDYNFGINNNGECYL